MVRGEGEGNVRSRYLAALLSLRVRPHLSSSVPVHDLIPILHTPLTFGRVTAGPSKDKSVGERGVTTCSIISTVTGPSSIAPIVNSKDPTIRFPALLTLASRTWHFIISPALPENSKYCDDRRGLELLHGVAEATSEVKCGLRGTKRRPDNHTVRPRL